MPWCPQCGDEYREGVTDCPKCGSPLTDQAPPPQITPWRERLPRPLRRVFDAFARSSGYASEAYRLLRRHRVLLLLPVAAAVFNAVEFGTAAYVGFRYTRAGRELMARWPRPPDTGTTEPGLRLPKLIFIQKAGYHLAYPVPAPYLQGTTQAIGLAATGPDSEPAPLGLLPWALLLGVSLPLQAAVLAGYYGLVAGTAAQEAVARVSFWASLRRYGLRFYAFGLLLLVVTTGSVMTAQWFWPLSGIYYAAEFAGWLVTVALALTLVAVAADDASPWRALRSGAAVLLRDLPVAALFLSAWVIVLALIALIQYVERLALHPSLASVDITVQQLYAIPEKAVLNSLLAVVGTWLLIASFLWYSSRRPAPRGGPSPQGRGGTGGRRTGWRVTGEAVWDARGVGGAEEGGGEGAVRPSP
jgi:hypothetical protein